MSHLQKSLENIIAGDPSIIRHRRVPTGTVVRFYGRSGAMRQGRTEFPALVLQQHPDDGSLDLIVFFEAEDMIWEQRVGRYDEATNPHHSWAPVEPIEDGTPVGPVPYAGEMSVDALAARVDHLKNIMDETRQVLMAHMYGDYEIPALSLIEYLVEFEKKLNTLESRLRK